ncbi:segregation and condensation protein B [Nonomuraea fuscirosea]|uniref:Segregation and condensation protein B n=1 Tax=Nonomuraea fuscirosea TaxID=1291556 RepID=A0A2T0MVE6_9ACTN|nr:segregation and condensation protein B [Nonomuraea fuscirosea]
MTDDNPLPNPRRSPDSDPPLPAWMTLPGSLVQPGAPAVEETSTAPDPARPATAPAEDTASVAETTTDSGPQEAGTDSDSGSEGGVPSLGAWDGATSEEATEDSRLADAVVAEPDAADEPTGDAEPAAVAVEQGAPKSDGPEPDVAGSGASKSGAAEQGEPEPGVVEHGGPESGVVERGGPESGVVEASGLGPEVAGFGGPGAGAPGRSGLGPDVVEQAAEGGSEGGPTLAAALEAILLVVDEPVAEVTLAQVLERPTHEVGAALRGLAAEYTASGRGFDLREVAGGWRFYTRADCAQLVERFVRDGQQSRLTQAALETLAVVAYRQPVSRARVAAVRGVNSDGVMRTLVARGLVEEAGSDPESQAVLYRTSSYFLERLGLRDLSELPELAPFLPDDLENLEETTK